MKRVLPFLLVAAACQSDPVEPVPAPGDIESPAPEAREDGKADLAAAGFRRCSARFTPSPAAGWRHTSSRFISLLGSPVHAASDVLAKPGATGALQARMAYGGILSKELEDEWVWIFWYDCTAWRYLGYARTDDEGRFTFTLASGLPAGRYDVRVEVVGDASSAPLTLWVLPSGTHVAVFDVDGTLTTDDTELYEQILLGHVPQAWPGADDVTWAEDTRHEIVVYLTGRPEILAGKTRSWLSGQGFAPGALHLARSAGDVLPTNSGVGTYKADWLASLRAAGYVIDDAFGNATTDVYAYARAAIPLSRTWIIGPNAGSGGTRPVTGGWDGVAGQLFGEAPVSQPFGW